MILLEITPELMDAFQTVIYQGFKPVLLLLICIAALIYALGFIKMIKYKKKLSNISPTVSDSNSNDMICANQ